MNYKIFIIFFISLFIIFSCNNRNNSNSINKPHNTSNQQVDTVYSFGNNAFYSHYSGLWDTGEKVNISLKFESDFVSGYLIFLEQNLYYDFSGVVDDKKNANIMAVGLNDSLGFMMKFIDVNNIEVSFYPPQSSDIQIFKSNYDQSTEIEYFAIDTTYSTISPDEDSMSYEISYHVLIFDKNSDIYSKDSFLEKNMNSNGNLFYDSILVEEITDFEDAVKNTIFSDWYSQNYQEVLFNEFNILSIGNYAGGYTGGASTWSDEEYLIFDFKTNQQLKFYDIFKEDDSDFEKFIKGNYESLSNIFEYDEPVFYFTNEYFYITFYSSGAVRTGDVFEKIPISKLNPYFTTTFKENILTRF